MWCTRRLWKLRTKAINLAPENNIDGSNIRADSDAVTIPVYIYLLYELILISTGTVIFRSRRQPIARARAVITCRCLGGGANISPRPSAKLVPRSRYERRIVRIQRLPPIRLRLVTTQRTRGTAGVIGCSVKLVDDTSRRNISNKIKPYAITRLIYFGSFVVVNTNGGRKTNSVATQFFNRVTVSGWPYAIYDKPYGSVRFTTGSSNHCGRL